MLLKILIFSFIISWGQAQGEEIQGQFSLVGENNKTIIEGEIFRGLLKIWPFPLDQQLLEDKIEGHVFLNFFRNITIDKIEYSKNNSDVLEITGLFVLEKAFSQKDFYIWYYDDFNIPVEIIGINSSPNSFNSKKMTLYEEIHAENKKLPWPMIIIFSFFLMILLGFLWNVFLKRKYKKLKAQTRKSQKDQWIIQFNKAQARSELEVIFTQFTDWGQLFEHSMAEFEKESFFILMSDRQYMKSWSEEELNEIAETFQEMRRKLITR